MGWHPVGDHRPPSPFRRHADAVGQFVLRLHAPQHRLAWVTRVAATDPLRPLGAVNLGKPADMRGRAVQDRRDAERPRPLQRLEADLGEGVDKAWADTGEPVRGPPGKAAIMVENVLARAEPVHDLPREPRRLCPRRCEPTHVGRRRGFQQPVFELARAQCGDRAGGRQPGDDARRMEPEPAGARLRSVDDRGRHVWASVFRHPG